MNPQQTTQVSALLKKYARYMDNCLWHIKTNKPPKEEESVIRGRLQDWQEMVNDLERINASLPAAPGWVKCSERMPDKVITWRFTDMSGAGVCDIREGIILGLYKVPPENVDYNVIEWYAESIPQESREEKLTDIMQLKIGRLEVNCFNEDGEMSFRIGNSRYQSLDMDETKELLHFIHSHIQHESDANT